MTDLEVGVIAFDFQSETYRDWVLDMSPWAIHGHCLNLKVCPPNQCTSEIEFGMLQMWVQVHDLCLEMLNAENTSYVANTIGKCIEMDSETDMQKRGYLRLKIEVKLEVPLKSGYWWTTDRWNERWTQIKCERVSDFCYGCGNLGHNAQACNRDITLSKVNSTQPMYGPWTTCARQRKQSNWHQIGDGNKTSTQQRDPGRNTWKGLMKESGAETSGSA